MKRLLLCCVLALCGGAAAAQNQLFKITSDEGEVLAYSTVYINGKGYATADRNATLNIPRAMLNVGDTISASYVGYENGKVIYDGYQKGGYLITLNMGQLERVTIFGQKETRKAFRTIRSLTPVARTGDYSFRFVMDADGKELCRGDVYHYFQGKNNRIYMELDKKHKPALQDKQKVDEFRYVVLPTLQDIFYTTSRAVATDLMYINVSATKVRMTAEKGKITTFLLNREDNGKAYDKVISSMVYVDVDTLTRNIVEARMDIKRANGHLELRATFLTKGHSRYPNVIEATYVTKEGTEYRIDIYDTHMITKKDEPHIFKKESSVNIWDMDNELIDVEGKFICNANGYSGMIVREGKLEPNEDGDANWGGKLTRIQHNELLERLAMANIIEW